LISHIGRDHTQLVGLRFNILEPDASGGVYKLIGNTIANFRAPGSSELLLAVTDADPAPSVDVAAIVAPTVVGLFLAGTVLAVVVRKRTVMSRGTRDEAVAEAAKRSSVIGFSSFSSGKENINSENPMFDVSVVPEEPELEAASSKV
jgi:hypothetical protein